MKPNSMRYPLLDLIRYFAAIQIALYHWGLEVGERGFSTAYEIPVIGDLIRHGNLGVDIFFLISGFVIIETAQKKDSLDFLIARFIRLFPGLVISMTIVGVVGSHFIRPYNTPLKSYINSIFLTFQATAVEPLATQLWTLIYEVKFYGAITLLLLFFPKAFRSINRILLILLLWQITFFLSNKLGFIDKDFINQYLGLDRYGVLFACGICLNLLSKIQYQKISTRYALLGAFLYFLESSAAQYQDTIQNGIIMGVFCLLIGLSPKINFGRRLSNSAKWLGASSYLIYLLHEQLGMATLNLIQAHAPGGLVFTLISAIGLLTVFAVVLSKYVENPIQNLMKMRLRDLIKR